MKIAIIGIRGIPFIYSGFEVFGERFAVDFAKNNHKVTVYCRANYFKKRLRIYKGVYLVYIPTLKSKFLETIIHSFFSTVHACFFSQYDALYYLGVSNSIFTLMPRFFGIRTLVNIDGLDWKREKWKGLGKIFLRFSEYLSSVFPNRTITDSSYVKTYYKKQYGRSIDYLPYGFFPLSRDIKIPLSNFGLEKNRYYAWVGRLVPDNKLEELILAFKKIKTDHRLVIIGDDLYKSDYKEYILNLVKKDPRIILTGFIPHDQCIGLIKNSLAYIETKRSGGTHPSLIDAMGAGCLIISNDHEASRSILKDCAFYYRSSNSVSNLRQTLKKIISLKNFKMNQIKIEAKKEAKKRYSWRKIINAYDKLLTNLVRPQKSH